MTVRRLNVSDSIGAKRGEPVVVIPTYKAPSVFARCLEAVVEHTPLDVPILVLDDASPDGKVEKLVARAGESRPERELLFARQPRNVGFVENANTGFAMAAPGDVVLLNSDCVVSPRWIELLREAAYSDSLIATASALTNHGTILSVPERNQPRPEFPPGVVFDEAAEAVRAGSLRLRPRIPTALGHCVYIRRAALDLVGVFDSTFSPGYGEEVDFSQRCILQGLSHVAADDVLVLHAAGSSFGQHAAKIRSEHEQLIGERYPYYGRAVRSAGTGTTGPLSRSLSAARRAITGLTVTIDGRVLGPHLTGTQLHALELVAALWRTGGLQLRLVVPDNIGDYGKELLAGLEGVERIAPDRIGERMTPADVVHRPYQVFHPDDLRTLAHLGERIVVTHQDLISYRNPGYFTSPEEWQTYRRLTRQTLAVADRVVFFSRHAADDAVAEDLVEPERLKVIYVGTDHRAAVGRTPRRPGALDRGRDFLLCLGTDFRHKNRLFALALLEQLRDRHGWHGTLAFAGPHASHGTSAEDEAAFLEARPELRDCVVDLGSVDEEGKAWLLEHAELVLYPTIYEGFGLIPFEAAAAGTACMFAAQASLAEILPVDAATIVPWDATATSDRAIELIRSPEKRAALVGAIRSASSCFTWDATAAALVETYREAADVPATGGRAVWAAVDPSGTAFDEVALKSVVAAFPSDVHRPLVALSMRRVPRRLLFGTLRAIFVVGYFARHGRVPPPLSR